MWAAANNTKLWMTSGLYLAICKLLTYYSQLVAVGKEHAYTSMHTHTHTHNFCVNISPEWTLY